MINYFPSGETVTSHGSIEPDKDNIREEPYSLPQGFSWDTLDLGNPAVVGVHKHTLTAVTRREILPGLLISSLLFSAHVGFKHYSVKYNIFCHLFSQTSSRSFTRFSMRIMLKMTTTCSDLTIPLNSCSGTSSRNGYYPNSTVVFIKHRTST